MLNLISYIGIPSILSGIVLGLMKALHKYCKTHFAITQAENEALKNGMQALLRDRLLRNYREFVERGHAYPNEKENWKLLYDQYHALGGNGIVSSIYEKVLNIPEYETKGDD